MYVNPSHRSIFSNSLWKHAITTSDNNTEIKVWSCSTWECTQTIVFKSSTESELFFKAEIDPTSSYLVLTDTTNRGLYVLQMLQTAAEDSKTESSKSTDDENGSEVVETKSTAFVKSISEFALSSPILSFGIIDATVRKYKCAYNDIYLLEELDDYDEDNQNRYCVVIHLYLVQPKSVQECHVLYQPSLGIDADVGSSLSALTENSDKGDELLENMAVISAVQSPKEKESLAAALNSSTASNSTVKSLLETNLISNNLKTSPSLTKMENNLSQSTVPSSKSASLNLMTPDSFHSSGLFLFSPHFSKISRSH